MAKDAAVNIIAFDPKLQKQENFLLKQKVNKLFFGVRNKNIFN
jgi:hypothetical protein